MSQAPFDDFANPYRATDPIGMAGVEFGPGGVRRGKVGQVQWLGVLMILHGLLLFGLAGLMGVYAVVIPGEVAKQQNAPNGVAPQTVAQIVTITCIVLAVLFAVIGLVNLAGGLRIRKFRGRILTMLGLFSGMVSIMSCYCFPVSLGLAIFGMLVLMDPSVQAAFRMAEEGAEPEQIRRYFDQLPA